MIKASTTRGLMLVGVLMLAGTVAAAEDRCYTAEIPGTMVLPDGSKHAPGVLRICPDRDISPVSKLHRTDVDGRAVGMFLSVSRAIEDSVAEGSAQFVFKRDNGDDLNLIGYVITSCDKTTFFEIHSPGTVRETSYVSNLGAIELDDDLVLIASAQKTGQI
jgi:hypothetical protein